MKSAAELQSVVATQGKEQRQNVLYMEQFKEYFAKQHPIVRSLHWALMVLEIIAIVLAGIFIIVAFYQTFLWATTGSFSSLGKATYLPDAWVNFGLGMSFVAFPLGLDSMLMRIFPAIIFPVDWYRSNKSTKHMTGISAILAGFGIACAGAPGVARMVELAVQAIQKLL